MVNSCSAYGCKNRNSKGSHITFHRFPLNNKSLLKLWLYQIKRGNWEPSKYSVICSEHFTEDCFVVKGLQNSRRTLKSDAYPTIFSMAIYSEVLKKKVFPGRKTSEDVQMSEDSKEEKESADEVNEDKMKSASEDSKEEMSADDSDTRKESVLENDEKVVSEKDDKNEENGGGSEEMEVTKEDPKSKDGED